MERVLAAARGVGLMDRFAAGPLAAAVREAIDVLRRGLLDGEEIPAASMEPEAIVATVETILVQASRPRVRAVVNATGVVLHTNLGRALLAEAAARAAYEAGRHPVALEIGLGDGRRGERDDTVEEHLCALTGAEAATVVNNNAAAVLLALATTAAGREVVVSRGELVEIGGSFRIPEIMAAAGTTLREVGTTNRTHPRDYANAIGERTGALLKVHTSNYRVVGFTASVEIPELVEIATARGLPVIEDLGSGALIDTTRLGLPAEPTPRASIEHGAALVTFSGDKLLGGPQCGILVGTREWIGAARRHPLRRALRPDKMTLAALDQTLRLVRFDPDPVSALPSLRALARDRESMSSLAIDAAALLQAHLGEGAVVEILETQAQVGSGAQPTAVLESLSLAVQMKGRSPDALASAFRDCDPPILGRVEKDRFLLDLRMIENAAELLPNWTPRVL